MPLFEVGESKIDVGPPRGCPLIRASGTFDAPRITIKNCNNTTLLIFEVCILNEVWICNDFQNFFANTPKNLRLRRPFFGLQLPIPMPNPLLFYEITFLLPFPAKRIRRLYMVPHKC